MKSVIELEINAPREQVARLLADPANNMKWMDDLRAYEPLTGDPGLPGSRYRLVPKRGEPFVATVIERDLPARTRLELDGPTVAVSVEDDLQPLSGGRTRLVSQETFRFKGLGARIVGTLAGWSIRRAHRRHMQAFRQFAEREAGQSS